MFKTIVSSAQPYTFGEPVLSGSGCPDGSVNIIPSTSGDKITILFTEYAAQTTGSYINDRKACLLAIPVDIEPFIAMGIIKVDYRGNVHAPEGSATFSAEYFFAGISGPKIEKEYEYFEDDIFISNEVSINTVVWSGCGSSEIFRINTAIVAEKDSEYSEDTKISIDSTDLKIDQYFVYYMVTKPC